MFGSQSGEGTLAKKSLQFLQNISGKGLDAHEAHLDLPLTIILKSGLSPNLQYILKKCGKNASYREQCFPVHSKSSTYQTVLI